MGTVLISTVTGVYRYRSGGPGQSWERTAHGIDDQWVWLTLTDPTETSTVYAGTRKCGVFESTDGGTSWEPISDGQPFQYVRGMVIHPDAPGVLYVGTEPEIYRYDRSARTWSATAPLSELSTYPEWTFPVPPHQPHVKHMTSDPWNPRSVYAAVEEGWVLRTDDGGESWLELTKGMDFDGHMVEVHPEDRGRVYAATGQSVYVSRNRGDEWAELATRPARHYSSVMALDPKDPERLYVAAADGAPHDWPTREQGADSRLFVSSDGGDSWRQLTNGLPESFRKPARALVPTGADTLLLGIADGTVWSTEDHGESWSPVIEGLPEITNMSPVD